LTGKLAGMINPATLAAGAVTGDKKLERLIARTPDAGAIANAANVEASRNS
jgi:hypothetical protein